ncbi:hypothetical protein PV326_001630 [Microctonus aethiopoides]|nr:hypothetical protein PV326_001630 [Microctonus aethiopoides]
MSVDIFGRKFAKGVNKDINRGPPDYGSKVTTDSQNYMENKRLCKAASPEDANDAVPYATMMTTINHELDQIKQSISSIRNDVDIQKKNVSIMRNSFEIKKKNIASIHHDIDVQREDFQRYHGKEEDFRKQDEIFKN